MAIDVNVGRVFISLFAYSRLVREDAISALARHRAGDWGNVDGDDWGMNEAALADGSRLQSAYEDRTGTAFLIITTPDRSTTTIVLAEEF